MKKMKIDKYISGNEAFFDEDKQLHYCYVGLNKPNMPLVASYYGTSHLAAIKASSKAAKALNELIRS